MKYVADVRLSVPQYLLAGECLRLRGSWFADFPASLRVLEDVDSSSWLNPANDHIRNARIEDTEW